MEKPIRQTSHQINTPVPAIFIFSLMIAICLVVAANTANAATYYLNASVTKSGDGKSLTTAFKTIADAQAALNALPNKGSGNTVRVYTGNYGSYTETDISRTNWLIYKAATGKTPVLEKISIQNNTKKNTYLKFDGFKIQAPVPSPMPADDGNWHSGSRMLTLYNANYVNISNCNFVGYNKYLTTGQDVRFCDYFTYHHNRQQKTRNGILVYESLNPTITYNYISEMSEGSGISIYTGCPNATVSHNHVFGMYTHKDDPYFPHNLVGTEYYHPGSLMSLRSSPIVIRNNVVHDGGSQLLMFYDDSGSYSDVLMENNLLYDGGFDDGVSPSYFTGRVAFYKLAPSLTHPIVIRNNTFVGRVENSSVSLESLSSRYYGNTVYSYNPASGYDGAGLTVVNNILVGPWSSTGNGLPHPGKYPNMTEGYNIAWSRSPAVGGSYLNNTIAFWYTGGKYHGYPCYFEDLGASTPDTQEYDYSRDGVTKFFAAGGMHFGPAGSYADRVRDRQGLLDFHLAAGSPAIGRGNSNNQPSDSLGTIDPNGFIRDDGLARNALHHSSGCYEYEYAQDDLSFAPIGNKEVNEGSILTFPVIVSDPNAKPFIEEHNLPSEPNFKNNIFSWTPDYNDAGSYEATFAAQNNLFKDYETISIIVNNVNRSPVLAAIGNKSVNENSLLNFLISATDPDGNSITYSAENLPRRATFAGRTFNWTPDYSQSGTYQVKFTASDGQAQDSQTINLTVNNVNRPPAFTAIGDKSVNENSLLNFLVSATDPDGDSITYSAQGLPSGAAFAGQIFNWTPDYSQSGIYQVAFTAADGQAQDSQTVNLTVNNVNRSPVLAAIGDKSVNENSLLNFLVSATDPDGDLITYSAQGLPSGAAFAGQIFNWTPDYSQSGIYQVAFTAADGQAQTSQTVNITVNNVLAIFLNENFDDGNYDGWTIIDEGTLAGPSSWSAATGAMVQKSNIYTSSFPSQPGTYALYKTSSTWTNYTVSLTMKSTDSESIGVMFRYKDKDNYYRFAWDKNRKQQQLVKKYNGSFTVLVTNSGIPYVAGRDYQLDIVTSGTTLQVFVDNSLVMYATDSSITAGSIAMYCWANAGSYFDNITVREL